ncbi:MAG: hypothetical protein ABL977_13510 [Candidatus Eisenbacteria bacterium]
MTTTTRKRSEKRLGVLDQFRIWSVGEADTEIVVTGRGSLEVDPRTLLQSKQVQTVIRKIREADSKRDETARVEE